jgi:hypothetical protein
MAALLGKFACARSKVCWSTIGAKAPGLGINLSADTGRVLLRSRWVVRCQTLHPHIFRILEHVENIGVRPLLSIKKIPLRFRSRAIAVAPYQPATPSKKATTVVRIVVQWDRPKPKEALRSAFGTMVKTADTRPGYYLASADAGLTTPLGGEEFQTNLIMPEPTIFLSRKLPTCSIVRPTATKGAAMGALKFLTDIILRTAARPCRGCRRSLRSAGVFLIGIGIHPCLKIHQHRIGSRSSQAVSAR